MSKYLRTVFVFIAGLLLVLSSISPAYAVDFNKKLKHTPDLDSRMKLNQALADQLNLISKDGEIDKSLKNAKGEVRVIVHYNEPSVALERGLKMSKNKKWSGLSDSQVQAKVDKQQAKAESKMKSKKVKFKKNRDYDTVLNATAMTVDADDLETLAQVDDVAYIEKDTVVQLDPSEIKKRSADIKGTSDTNADEVNQKLIKGITHLEIPKVWELGNKGKGVKVGVIDTGIDYNHPDLKAIYKGGRNYATGSDYLTQRAADDPYETDPKDRPSNLPEVNASGSTYWTTHGTHVAGTIAAQGKNEYGMMGIAPNVDLYAYRVLGAYGSGYTAWIVGGIEDSVKDGMDVINLSLGNTSPEENQANAMAVNNAMLMGVVANVATGNSGPNRSTIGGPATAPLGIGVGNTTLPELVVSSNVTIEAGSFKETLDAKFMAFNLSVHPSKQVDGSFEVVSIPGVGLATDFDGKDVKGKVALIQRGEIAFVDKIENAKNAGAVGAIIYNSAAGTNSPGPADIFLGTSFDFIPTLDMSHTTGKAFAAAIGSSVGKVTFNSFKDDMTKGDEVNSSSSRGPSKPNFDIKPDVAAPGTNILSTIPVFKSVDPEMNYDKAYAQYTGTSMATPHITAITALLLELHPEWTPFDVKSALSNNAKLLDTAKYDVFSQGAGLVQPYKSATTNAFLKVSHVTSVDGKEQTHTRGTMAFGNVAPKSTEQKVVKELEITNLDGRTSDYKIEVMPTKKATGTLAATELKPEAATVSVAGKKIVKFTLTVPAGTSTDGNEYLGYVKLSDDKGSYQVPFAVNLSEANKKGFQEFALKDNHISPNGDGVKDSTDLSVKFYDKQQYTLISYYDLLNPQAGINKDGYVGDIVFELGLQSKVFKIDGKMYNLIDSQRVNGEVEDGVYAVDALTMSTAGNATELDGPLFVKRKATKVSDVKVSNGKVTGMVDDLYINALEELSTVYGLNYNPGDFIDATYKLENKSDAKEGKMTLGKDKSMTFDSSLSKGVYHLTLNFNDAAGNKAAYKYTVDFDKNTVVDGHIELPEVPVDPPTTEEPTTEEPTTEEPTTEQPETPAKVFEVKHSHLTDIDKNNVKDLDVRVPASYLTDGQVKVSFDKDVIKDLAGMRQNKTLKLNIEGNAVSFTVDNFKQFSAYDKVVVTLKQVDGAQGNQVSDIFEVVLTGYTNGKEKVITSLNDAMSVYIEAAGAKYNVYDLTSNKVLKSKYDKKTGQYSVDVKEPSSYVVIK